MNSNRGRYPPGIGAGRGGGMNANPAFQSRPPHQQQYVQRNLLPNHHHQQYFQQQQHQQQQQQQQQWLRRGQLGGSTSADSAVDEVEKTVQSEAVDPRCVFAFINVCFMVGFSSRWEKWVAYESVCVTVPFDEMGLVEDLDVMIILG